MPDEPDADRPAEVPADWAVVRHWTLDDFLEPRIQIFSFLLLVLGLLLFAQPVLAIHGTIRFGLLELVLLLPNLVVVAVLHEGLHGLGVLAWGGRPRIGLAWVQGVPVPYATGEWVVHRLPFVVFALAPLIGLTALGLVALPHVSPVVAVQIWLGLAINLSGAAADLFMAYDAIRAPRGSMIEETKETTVIYAPATEN